MEKCIIKIKWYEDFKFEPKLHEKRKVKNVWIDNRTMGNIIKSDVAFNQCLPWILLMIYDILFLCYNSLYYFYIK